MTCVLIKDEGRVRKAYEPAAVWNMKRGKEGREDKHLNR